MRRMRVSLLAIAIAAVAAAPAFGQGTEIGFKGGIQWADLTDDLPDAPLGTIETSTRLAWAFGGFFTYSFLPRLALQAETLWSVKGAEIQDDDDLKLQYLEVPLLLRLQSGAPMSGFRPYIMAGPYAAFEVDCEFEPEAEESRPDQECAGEGRNATLIGLAAGAGFEIPLGNVASVLAEGRFGRDFSSVFDEDVTGDVDAKNQTFGVYVGLTVPLRGAGHVR